MPDRLPVYAIDDDEAVLASVRAVLSQYGRKVVCYSSAEQFLAAAHLTEPGCVVTDLRMPGTTGVELQRLILEAGSPLAVVVVTGVADVPTAVSLMERGAVTLLQKPYDPAALLAAVERGLAASSARARRRADEKALAERLSRLSEEERRVMQAMLSGAPNKAIAERLDLSLRTLDRRRHAVLQVMGVTSVAELATILAGNDDWRNLATPPQWGRTDVITKP